jgi:hypothetical protein
MENVFSKHGLVVVGFNNFGRRKYWHQGTLKVCHAQKGKKFYRFTPTIHEKLWVYITDEIVEPLYGCKVVDYHKDECDIDTPVYLVYLSDVAVMKTYANSEEVYWIFNNGWFTDVCKEWLMYYDLLPGVNSKTVIEPLQTPETIRKHLITFENED